MIYGVVPARGGSKGVPGKNVRRFLGRPLIWHTIQVALASSAIDRVLVSTDDDEIAAVAREAGAEVPFRRPAELSGDDILTLDVLKHAAAWIERESQVRVEAVVTLQPTSPFRRVEHLDAAIRLWRQSGVPSVISVCRSEHSPYWMGRMEGDRFVPLLGEVHRHPQRQAVPETFRLNGAVYVTSRDTLLVDGKILGEPTHAIVMDEDESLDIDTELDFAIGELIAAKRGWA